MPARPRYWTSLFGTGTAPTPGDPRPHSKPRTRLDLQQLEDRTTPAVGLLKDIAASAADSAPAVLTAVGNVLYFTATDGTNGRELWKTDGSTSGTVLVKDIRAGATGSDPAGLTAVGGTLFFTANDGVNGRELWKTDGTTAGTVLVTDIYAGLTGSAPASLTAVGSVLFFSADDATGGRELWKSDGTAAGTVRVKDIRSGTTGSSPDGLKAVGGTLFFTADDGTNGRELWKTDGTTGGTVLVKDVRSGAGNSYPRELTAVGGTLFFSADDGANGRELWKTDGTTGGTVLVKDIGTGASYGSYLHDLTAVGSTLFFSAYVPASGYELWKSDGTAGGTVIVKDVRPGAGDGNPTGLTAAGGTLFFSADDGTNGAELWKSDGTSGGTVLVKDIRAGANGSGPQSFTAPQGVLYFTSDDGANGTQVWTSDGTATGTVLVTPPGAATVAPQQMAVLASGKLFFAATTAATGNELWRLTFPFADDFNRSNASTLGGNWVTQVGTVGVSSNTAAGQVSGANVATLNGASAADVTVSAVVKAQTGTLSAIGLAARYTGTGGTGDTNMYWGALNAYSSTQYLASIWKNVGGTWSQISYNANPITAAAAVGKTLAFEVIGASLRLYYDGALYTYVTDTSLTAAGSVGVRTGLGAAVDDFAAAAVPAAALPFADAFTYTAPRTTLSTAWQERIGYFSVAGGTAAGQVSGANVATLNGASAADVTITSDLFFTAAGQVAGLIARYAGASGTGDQNYYVADLVPQTNGDALVRLMKDVNGTKTTLASTTVAGYFPGATFPPTTAPKLRFQLIGTQLKVYLDNLGTPLLTATDSTFTAGAIGIRLSQSAAADNFSAS